MAEDQISNNQQRESRSVPVRSTAPSGASPPTQSTTSTPKRRNPNWGGRRPGAGAPKGNLNGFKHGRRSRQLAAAASIIAANPKLRETLVAIGNRAGLKQAKAEDVAIRWFVAAVTKGITIETEEQARDFADLLREVEK